MFCIKRAPADLALVVKKARTFPADEAMLRAAEEYIEKVMVASSHLARFCDRNCGMALSAAERFPLWFPVLRFLGIKERARFAQLDFPMELEVLDFYDADDFKDVRRKVIARLLHHGVCLTKPYTRSK